jgi:transcriptional antiterminator NusG
MMAAEETKRWYILQVRSGFENRVVNLLREHIRVEKMEDQFGEIVVPTEEVVEMKGGQKKTSERRFFPGYVLVMMHMSDQTWHLVKSINVANRYVLGFVGGDKPTPITNEEADRILQRVKEGVDKPRPKTLFEPGEVVRVIEGPFADFNGVVEDVNYEKSRLRVSVLIFGRSTPVELEFSQVEKS